MDTKQKIILSGILVVGLAIIFGIIFYGAGKQGTVLEKREGEEIQKEQSSIAETNAPKELPVIPGKNPLGLDIPAEVYYYTGTISNISGHTITLTAKATDNYLEQDITFTVHTDKKTRFEKYSTPLYLPPGQSPRDYQQGTGTLTDFKVGDRVTVHANTNIAGLSEFTATRVLGVEMVE